MWEKRVTLRCLGHFQISMRLYVLFPVISAAPISAMSVQQTPGLPRDLSARDVFLRIPPFHS